MPLLTSQQVGAHVTIATASHCKADTVQRNRRNQGKLATITEGREAAIQAWIGTLVSVLEVLLSRVCLVLRPQAAVGAEMEVGPHMCSESS